MDATIITFIGWRLTSFLGLGNSKWRHEFSKAGFSDSGYCLRVGVPGARFH